MPTYLFYSEETNTYEDIFFKFSDVPSIGEYISYEGRNLRRCASIPQAASDTVNIDPHSAKDFIKATNKSGTFGEMFDRSAEMSRLRAEKNGGVDEIKAKYEAEKGVGGVPQASAKPKESALLKKLGIKIKK